MYEVFLLLLQEILWRIKGESWEFGGMCVGCMQGNRNV